MNQAFREELRGIIREELRGAYKHEPEERALITSEEASKLIGIKPQTLAVWRSRGRGPAYHKISESAVRYSMEEIKRWKNDLMVKVQ